jgi:hypothetical protein
VNDVNLKVFVKECSVSNIKLHVSISSSCTSGRIVAYAETTSICGTSGAMQVFVCLPVKNDSVSLIGEEILFVVYRIPVDVCDRGVVFPVEKSISIL